MEHHQQRIFLQVNQTKPNINFLSKDDNLVYFQLSAVILRQIFVDTKWLGMTILSLWEKKEAILTILMDSTGNRDYYFAYISAKNSESELTTTEIEIPMIHGANHLIECFQFLKKDFLI